MVLQQLIQKVFYDSFESSYAQRPARTRSRSPFHLLYDVAVCDLGGISLPGFAFTLATALRDAPSTFVTQWQR
jgi:hypothetical protein